MENGHADAGGAITEPLLSREEQDDVEGASNGQREGVSEGTCSTAGGVCNLAVTAVGGGMLALPKAVSTVGVGVAVLLFALVSALTFKSTSIISRHASRVGARSYGDLISSEFGPKGALVLRLAIILHVGGVVVVYLIIIADMLCGSAPEFAGVLPTLLGRHDGVWFLSRPFVVAVLLVLVILPMLVPRTLASVSRFSGMSIIMVLCIAAMIVALAVAAVVQGKAAHIHVWPDFVGTGASTKMDCVTAVLSSISVLCLSMTCHFNLVPIQLSLKGGDQYKSMKFVIAAGVAIIAGLYATVGISGYVMFGERTKGDVLSNMTIRYVSTLVHPTLAAVIMNLIAGAYSFNLCVNTVLKIWPLRENVVEVVSGKLPQQLTLVGYYACTLALVAAAYCVFVVVPSVYAIIELVGSTACVCFSFVFPACLLLKEHKSFLQRGCAAVMLLLSAVMAIVAVGNRITGRGGYD